MSELIVGICLGTVLCNLVILGLSTKLYTEYFKDASARGRKP